MRNIIKNIILGALILLLAASCDKEKFFELERIPESPWTDLNTIERAAVAPYNYLAAPIEKGQPSWNAALGVTIFMDMASSDLGAVAPTVPVANAPWDVYAYRTYHEISITPGSKGGGRQYNIFKLSYQMLTACNDPLDFIAKSGNGEIFPGVTTDHETIKRIKAELLFNRARAYSYLVRNFCPPYNPGGDNSKKLLPYKVSYTGDPQQLRNTQLASAEEIYTLIISDLTTAKSLMPVTYNQEGRANYYAICGELARIYFLIGKYSEARAECDEILNSGKFPLQSDIMTTWTKAPGEAPASEVIMEFVPDLVTNNFEADKSIVSKCTPYGGKNGGRGTDWIHTPWAMFYMSNYFMKETGWMVDPANGDYTVGALALQDKRYNNTYLRLEGYIPLPAGMDKVTYRNTIMSQNKGITWPSIWLDKYYRGAQGNNTKDPLYRSAEFYLTRAAIDCVTDFGDMGEADLNIVRNRAGLSSIFKAEFPNKDDWFNEIHRERIREIGNENGDRIRYLMSLRLPLGLGDRPVDGSKGAIIYPPYEKFYFRIPEDEVNGNAAYPQGFNQD